jgi:mannose/fructose-specific phosphotransferase system component IIA
MTTLNDLKERLRQLDERITSSQQETDALVDKVLADCAALLSRKSTPVDATQPVEDARDVVTDLLIEELNKMSVDDDWLLKVIVDLLGGSPYNKQLSFQELTDELTNQVTNVS